MNGPNTGEQITGLLSGIYTPQNPGDTKFQVPIAFDTAGFLLYENPLGSGEMSRIQGPLIIPPANSHMIGAQAQNRAWMAFSNLIQSTSPLMAVYDLNRKALEPFSQKPFGWNWQANTPMLVGEYGTPSVTGGNGHIYRVTTAGTTGGVEPIWPTADGATFTDGSVTWTEFTPVIANTVPPPNAPTLTLVGSGGSFAANLDVYIALTLVNPKGQTLAGPSSLVSTTLGSSSVNVTNLTLAGLLRWIQQLPAAFQPTGFNIYVASVSHGSPAPAQSSYQQFGSTVPFGAGTTTVTGPGAGSAPPLITSARITPAGLQPPNTAPPLVRNSGAGAFAAGRDVYVIATATTASGETTPSPYAFIPGTVANDQIQVSIQGTQYQVTSIKIYEADVAAGSAAPPFSAYSLVGAFQPNSTANINSTATGAPPPTTNTAGTFGNIGADTTGNFRYASFQFVNNNENFSGFTSNSIVSTFVDVPGFGLYVGLLPIGPGNIKARITNFTTADGTNAGPFFYIPPVSLTAPASIPADVVTGIPITATRINDNASTNATFDFTDNYLIGNVATNNTDRLRVFQPPAAVDVYYSVSTRRLILTGGYGSSHLISLQDDLESFYQDTSPLPVGTGDGELPICAREFGGTLYSLKERSGHIINPKSSDPSQWDVQRRWTGMGPCGPRAVDVCQEFMVFAHRSGLYIFEGSLPELISTEIPINWGKINWAAQQTIWINIDVENKEIRIGVPMGNSSVPNLTITLNYYEGKGKAIHFSAYVQKEVALIECRKWSLDDIAANCCIRMERQIPGTGLLPTMQVGGGSFQQSQICFGSSAPDGTVQAIVPGIYNDNGAGIEQVYETSCSGDLMAVSMLGGVLVSMTGAGRIDVSVMVGRIMKTSPGQGREGPYNMTNEIMLAPFFPKEDEFRKYSCGARGQNEQFRLRLSNGKRPDNYFDVKFANIYTRPLFTAQTAGSVSGGK